MKEQIKAIIEKAVVSIADFEVIVPEREIFGHYSISLAMRVAKEEKKDPLDVAKELAEKISASAPPGFFEKVEAVAPGFVNFWISKRALQDAFRKFVEDGKCGLANGPMTGKTVIVEYTDPNLFKIFHIGHLMSNAIGESISRIMEAQGADVKRFSYGGDVGLHVAKSIFGVLAKKEKIANVKGESEKGQLKFWADAYVFGSARYEEGEDSKREIDSLNKVIFEKTDAEINELYAWGREISIKHFFEMFARLGSTFHKNYWESEVFEEGTRAVEEGLSKGIFEKSEGAIVFKGEPYGLHTRVFVNSKGIPTYEAKELGLAIKKRREFAFDESVVITGNEQNDYFKVLLKVMDLLMPDSAGKTVHIGHGMLRFASGKMSSRKGNVIAAEALIDEVKTKIKQLENSREGVSAEEREVATEYIAIGAIKYSILKQSPGQDIIFDFDRSLSLEGDSGPYLQYAYTRVASILRKAKDAYSGWDSDVKFERPRSEPALALMRKILQFPDVVASCGKLLSTSQLAKYLYELASLMNRFYESTPILADEDANRRSAHLSLVRTAGEVMKKGLWLLGATTPEKM